METVFTASTHDFLLFFTDTGKVHRKKGYLIPEAGRSAKGTNIVNILPVEPGEKVTAMLHVKSLEDDSVLMMVTRKGTVKRLPLNVLNTARKAGIRAITLEEGDELIAVLPTSGEDNILLMTHDGMAICFKETDVRCMGRDAVGVRGIRLKEGDYVVSAARGRGECHFADHHRERLRQAHRHRRVPAGRRGPAPWRRRIEGLPGHGKDR